MINSGSSTLKYKLINMKDEKVICKGIFENIGTKKNSIIKFEKYDKIKIEKNNQDVSNYKIAFKYIKNFLLNKNYGVIDDISNIDAIGHRVVHGGKYFECAKIINKDVKSKIEKLIEIAPLHNSNNLLGINSCEEIFGKSIPQVAVFDTSLYFNLSPEIYMYAIPYEYYEKYNIRKYGFHGTSHNYIINRYEEITNNDIKKLKIITCHLGNGSSITATKYGKVIDTSMGFTPLGGVMMGTRSGSLDPSIVTFIAQKENLTYNQVNDIFNKKSGLLGISGISNDVRDINYTIKNRRSKLAQKMFEHHICKYIGSYILLMQGCDVIIFTGGIGESHYKHRENICKKLSFIGLNLDSDKNIKMILGKEGIISDKKSKIEVLVIPTDEELAIARETKKVVLN